MKLILSRKGYDAGAGGRPSPILPDGRLISLPIPSRRDPRRYRDLRDVDGTLLVDRLRDLEVIPRDARARCHLDPDLAPWTVPRSPAWRPAFGQTGAAAGHLDRQGVGRGDLFLFFGWFRPTERVGGALRYVRGRHRDLHLLFGWLQVAEVVRPRPGTRVPAWLRDHPHCADHHRASPANRIYLAADRLSIAPTLSGAGLFGFDPRRVLTAPGRSRACWSLDPAVFAPLTISYHSPASWAADHFRSASKGQEFVLDATPAVVTWLRERLPGSTRQPDR